MAWETNLEILEGKEKEIDQGLPFETVIIENQKYEKIYVQAIISKDPAKLPDGEELLVRDFQENMLPDTWRIKILEKKPPPHAAYLT